MESVGSEGSPAPKKPALLKGGMILCWINAVALLLDLWAFPSLTDSATLHRKAITDVPGLGDSQVQAVFLTDFVSGSQLFLIPVLALSVIVAYGLAKDRHWSRWMMMLLLILGVVFIPPPLDNAIGFVLAAALAGFGWWYLYKKPNVVEYYQAIKQKQLQ